MLAYQRGDEGAALRWAPTASHDLSASPSGQTPLMELLEQPLVLREADLVRWLSRVNVGGHGPLRGLSRHPRRASNLARSPGGRSSLQTLAPDETDSPATPSAALTVAPRRRGRELSLVPPAELAESDEVAVISRDELVRRLAAVSHKTWMRQKHRDQGVPLEEIPTAVTDHDLERAEDAVAELERLGLYRPAAAAQ